MHEVKAIIRPERLEDVVGALHEIPDLPGVTVSVVQGYGTRVLDEQGGSLEYGETRMSKLETVVPEALLTRVLETIERAARTGRPGDGMIFVIAVESAVRIRTGERGAGVL
jgi:nitrogen regulatory protein P-II 1